MFNCTPSWNWKEVPLMIALRVILKGILKVYFRLISSLMKSQTQNNFGKLPIKYKIGLRLFLLFTSGTQNIWCIDHSVYCRAWRKTKKIYSYLSEHFWLVRKSFTPDIRTNITVSFKEVWPRNERFVVFTTLY